MLVAAARSGMKQEGPLRGSHLLGAGRLEGGDEGWCGGGGGISSVRMDRFRKVEMHVGGCCSLRHAAGGALEGQPPAGGRTPGCVCLGLGWFTCVDTL
jgi:hypothetical protein